MSIKISFAFFFLCFIFPLLFFPQQPIENNPFKIAVKHKSERFINNPNFRKAQTFFLNEEWDSTLVYTMKELSVNPKSIELKDYCHFFRGLSFRHKKIYKEAKKEFLNTSKTFAFSTNVEMYLGEMALEEQEYKKALDYFKNTEQIDLSKLLGLKKNNIDQNIGLCYLLLEEFSNAEPYLKRSLHFQEQEKIQDTAAIIGSYINLANLYYNQYKDNLAIPYFEKAYHLSKKTNDFSLKAAATDNMAVVEENRKKFEQALKYRKEHEQWKDSLNDQNKIWQVAEFEKKFTVNEKQKEVIALEAKNKIERAERNKFLFAAVLLLLLLGTGFYFYREKVKANKIIISQKEDLDELNATKDKLFSIVSHDLRSSVNALKMSNSQLSSSIDSNNLEKAGSLVHKNSAIVNSAYNLLDNLLNWSLLQTKQSYFKMKMIPLYVIVDHVAYNYLPLMEQKSITFKNTIEDDMVFVDQESLKIVLRNLLDNAIKFSNPNGGNITIYSENTNNTYCNLIIEDTGIGMREAKRLELLEDTMLLSKKDHENKIGTGLGMQLCKSMIKKNKGQFFIESELGKGTKMIVSLLKTKPHAEC